MRLMLSLFLNKHLIFYLLLRYMQLVEKGQPLQRLTQQSRLKPTKTEVFLVVANME